MTVQACLLYEDSPNAPPVVLLPGVPPEAVRAPCTHIESSTGSILTHVLQVPVRQRGPGVSHLSLSQSLVPGRYPPNVCHTEKAPVKTWISLSNIPALTSPIPPHATPTEGSSS